MRLRATKPPNHDATFCRHTIRKVRGYVGHGEAGMLVVTNENTKEEHVNQLYAGCFSFGVGRVLEFWNVDHPQGRQCDDVFKDFKHRMIFEVP